MSGKIVPPYVKPVLVLTIVNVSIFIIRNLVVGTPIHDIVAINLFHGFVPLLLAYLINLFYDKLNGIWFWIVSMVWVLFYPNSPYMISTLKHIGQSAENIQNYDDLIMFTLAMLSFYYGYLSLQIMYDLYAKRIAKKYVNWVMVFVLLLSSLGYYMGRVLFLYSENFFTEPVKVIKLVLSHLFPIGQSLSAYALIFLFAIVQFLLIYMFRNSNVEPADTSNPNT